MAEFTLFIILHGQHSGRIHELRGAVLFFFFNFSVGVISEISLENIIY